MRFTFAFIIAFFVLGICASDASSAPLPKPTSKAVAKAPFKPVTLSKYEREKLEVEKASAPADEYFGKMKLSFLGINNTFRDQAIRAGDHTTNPTVTGPVTWAEDALRAWQKRYGQDPQLARSFWLAFLVDRKIWLPDFQQRASTYLVMLNDKFPATYFGKQAKASLQKGMTMTFYAPAVACDPKNSAASAAAPQSALPTPDPKHNIKVDEIPVPCVTAAPAPSSTH